MEALLVVGGAALVMIPFVLWLDRRSAAHDDVIKSPQKYSRRRVIGAHLWPWVVAALALTALPFMRRSDIEDMGNTRYALLGKFFPETSLLDRTNWWITGCCILIMWSAICYLARRTIRNALAKRGSNQPPLSSVAGGQPGGRSQTDA